MACEIGVAATPNYEKQVADGPASSLVAFYRCDQWPMVAIGPSSAIPLIPGDDRPFLAVHMPWASCGRPYTRLDPLG
jgi:hypothetical protein